MFEDFNNEYYFEQELFKDEYEVGDKVYYLNEKKKYAVGKIKEIEEVEGSNEKLYLITGCLYLRAKEHIYSLYV